MEPSTVLVQAEALKDFCRQIFVHLGETPANAATITDVLVAADLRGVDSHGVARLGFYVEKIRLGVIHPNAPYQIVHEAPATALLDAGAGMGQPVSYRAMEMAIEKANRCGIGCVTVRNSNHFGIAGYYAMMALEAGCIGVAMTNSAIFVVPTFGRDPMLGTNPIAVAAPAGAERPYVLDMATSTVPFGKLEIYDRLEKPMPLGWAADENGAPTQDATRVIHNMHSAPIRGGLTPLGGDGELLSGHKGYGLALLVELLSGVLSGALTSDQVYPVTASGEHLPAGLGHIFMALQVEAFRPLVDFQASLDDLERRLKSAPKAAGQDRIYIHGEKEFEQAERRERDGIPLNRKVWDEIVKIGAELGLQFPK